MDCRFDISLYSLSLTKPVQAFMSAVCAAHVLAAIFCDPSSKLFATLSSATSTTLFQL